MNTAKLMSSLFLVAVVAGIIANFNDIRRYVKITMM